MGKSRNANLASIKLVSALAFSKQDVYEPAEDTFLLADVILAEAADWDASQVPGVFVEVGSGSGYVVASVASMLRNEKKRGCYCLAVTSTVLHAWPRKKRCPTIIWRGMLKWLTVMRWRLFSAGLRVRSTSWRSTRPMC